MFSIVSFLSLVLVALVQVQGNAVKLQRIRPSHPHSPSILKQSNHDDMVDTEFLRRKGDAVQSESQNIEMSNEPSPIRRPSRSAQPNPEAKPEYPSNPQESRGSPAYSLDSVPAPTNNYGIPRGSILGQSRGPSRSPAPRPQPSVSSQGSRSNSIVPIISDDRTQNYKGEYTFTYEAGDGTRRQEAGTQDDGQISQGSWSYISPEGTPVEVSFISDHAGYQPVGDVIPVAPELPYQRSQQFLH